MTANIKYKGTDLDTLYQGILGTALANVSWQVSGTDISNRYTAITSTSAANGNLGQRIPATGILTSAGQDMSSLFAGNIAMYTLNSGVVSPSHAGPFDSPITMTHIFTVTFASNAELLSYFLYGGRIILTPTQTAGSPTAADTSLTAMFTQIGSLVIWDTGCYITGTGTGITVTSTGGSTVTGSQVTILSGVESGTYASNSSYIVKMQLTATNVITVTANLALTTHGTVADTYNGTYNSRVDQRNYTGASSGGPPSNQTAPTIATTVAP